MKYVTVKETSKKWNISERRIINLCNDGRIDGAYKNGMTWNIPDDATKPIDKRTNYSKLEQLKKTIVIAGINSEIGIALSKILLKENYKIIGLYQKNSIIPEDLKTNNIFLKEVDYFDKQNLLDTCNDIKEYLKGFVFMEIYFNLEDSINFDYDKFEDSYKINVFSANLLVRELVKKMNYDSSIVMVNSIEAYRGSFGASAYASAQAAKSNLVQTFANIFTEMYGVRINSIMAGWIGGVMESDDAFNQAKNTIPMKRLGRPEEIADDIYLMLTRHKYTTGSSLISDGGYLAVDEQSKTEDMDNGKFYHLLDKFFTEAKPKSTIWAASIMLPAEWNEDSSEVKFRQNNIDAVSRGVHIDRIFIIDLKDSEKYKDNPFLKMHTTHKGFSTTFIDKKRVQEENPELLTILGNGFDGIDEYVLMVDIPPTDKVRGYATMNKKEILEKRKCFEELKKYTIPLKDIMK